MQVELTERDDPRVAHILATGFALRTHPHTTRAGLDGIVARVCCPDRSFFHLAARAAGEIPRVHYRQKPAVLTDVATDPAAILRAPMPSP